MLVSPRRLVCAAIAVLTLASPAVRMRAESAPPWLEQYREPAARLIGEAVSDTFAWRRLAVLTDSIGHRLSGTAQLDRAIQWAVAEMKRDGLENVHTEKVMVPKWVRGAESAEIVEPARHPIAMLGLGGSVATPPDGVQADLLIVHNFEELDAHAARAKGRIVFKIASMSLEVDGSKYFLIHHTEADTVDKIDPVEMAKCAAAIAVMTYVVADLPQWLGD